MTSAVPDWLGNAMPELVRDYLNPTPGARARQFGQALERCAKDGRVIDIRRNGGVDAVAGVEPMAWDSEHFGVGFARLGPVCVAPSLEAAARTAAVEEICDAALRWSRDNGAKIVLRRMVGARGDEARIFERRKFSLVDTIVTLTAPASAQKPTRPVRAAVAADRAILLQLAQDAFPHSRFLNDFLLDSGKAKAVYVEWLERLLTGDTSGDKTGQGGVVMVAEHNGVPNGFIAMRRDPALDALVGQPIAPMEMFAVAVHARGQGLGTALLAAALDWSARHGARLVEASTWSTSDDARRSYARAGFQERDTLLTFHGHVS